MHRYMHIVYSISFIVITIIRIHNLYMIYTLIIDSNDKTSSKISSKRRSPLKTPFVVGAFSWNQLEVFFRY